MQPVSFVTYTAFQPTTMVITPNTKQLTYGVTGLLVQTQTTDVLGAIPQYRPLPTSVRVGSGGDPESEEILKEIEQSLDDEAWNLIDAKEELENLQEESNDKQEE